MQIEAGEECYPFLEDGEDLFGARAALQCKEGHVCVLNSTADKTYVCKQAYSQRGDLKYCSKDSDCPYDATCECDDSIGKNVCAPILRSSKGLWDVFEKYFKTNGVNEQIKFYEFVANERLYYNANYRCGAYRTKFQSAATAVKSSALATFFVALFVFLF